MIGRIQVPPCILNHHVLHYVDRIHLVNVVEYLSQQFIHLRRLEKERLEIKGRAAVFPSSTFEGLDELRSDASTAI
jgi:hypothetical protein